MRNIFNIKIKNLNFSEKLIEKLKNNTHSVEMKSVYDIFELWDICRYDGFRNYKISNYGIRKSVPNLSKKEQSIIINEIDKLCREFGCYTYLGMSMYYKYKSFFEIFEEKEKYNFILNKKITELGLSQQELSIYSNFGVKYVYQMFLLDEKEIEAIVKNITNLYIDNKYYLYLRRPLNKIDILLRIIKLSLENVKVKFIIDKLELSNEELNTFKEVCYFIDEFEKSFNDYIHEVSEITVPESDIKLWSEERQKIDYFIYAQMNELINEYNDNMCIYNINIEQLGLSEEEIEIYKNFGINKIYDIVYLNEDETKKIMLKLYIYATKNRNKLVYNDWEYNKWGYYMSYINNNIIHLYVVLLRLAVENAKSKFMIDDDLNKYLPEAALENLNKYNINKIYDIFYLYSYNKDAINLIPGLSEKDINYLNSHISYIINSDSYYNLYLGKSAFEISYIVDEVKYLKKKHKDLIGNLWHYYFNPTEKELTDNEVFFRLLYNPMKKL